MSVGTVTCCAVLCYAVLCLSLAAGTRRVGKTRGLRCRCDVSLGTRFSTAAHEHRFKIGKLRYIVEWLFIAS